MQCCKHMSFHTDLCCLVVRLFEENGELLTLFTKFQELKTKDSQMQSMELAEHATKVMSNLDEMINSLDDMDYFFRHLHSIGKLHRKLPGFKKEYFFVSISYLLQWHFMP